VIFYDITGFEMGGFLQIILINLKKLISVLPLIALPNIDEVLYG